MIGRRRISPISVPFAAGTYFPPHLDFGLQRFEVAWAFCQCFDNVVPPLDGKERVIGRMPMLRETFNGIVKTDRTQSYLSEAAR